MTLEESLEENRLLRIELEALRADKYAIREENLRKSISPMVLWVNEHELARYIPYTVRKIKKMRKEKAFIYLGYTSNMVTKGNREIIRYLTEHKMIDYLVKTGGGIEEEFIKCIHKQPV